MMSIMQSWITFTLGAVADFLMAEPVCYLTAMLLLSALVSIFFKLIYGKGGKTNG